MRFVPSSLLLFILSDHVRDIREPGDAFQFRCLIEIHQLHVAFDVIIRVRSTVRGVGQSSEKRSESIWTLSWCSAIDIRQLSQHPSERSGEGGGGLNVQTEVINKQWQGRERGNCTEPARQHDNQWLRRRRKLKAWWKTCGPSEEVNRSRTLVTTRPLLYWLHSSTFLSGCWVRAKQSQSVLAAVIFPRQIHTPQHTHVDTHTHTHTHTHKHITDTNTHGPHTQAHILKEQTQTTKHTHTNTRNTQNTHADTHM